MKIVQVDFSSDDYIEQINRFLEGNPKASIFHTPQWNIIVEDVYQTQFCYFVAMLGDEIAGVMPCHLVRNGRFKTIIYSPPRIFEVSYGGPIAIGDIVQQTLICSKLIKFAGNRELGNVVSLFNSPENTDWTEYGNWQKQVFKTAYVDLSLNIDEIWRNSIDGKRRNMIRKAEKNRVEVEVCRTEKFAEYFDLIQQMSQRTGISFGLEEYYRRILESFGMYDMARLYLARYEGVYLSGGIFLKYGKMCYYWHGATGSNVPNLGQGEFIQWQVIQWAKQSGCRWYDLVGIEKERLPNIAEFKLGFTNNIVNFHYVRYRRLIDAVAWRFNRILQLGVN
jgi:hypothetical protein